MEIKRCYETIIGASVGENQLVRNGDFSDGTTGWSGTATISASDNVLSVTQSESSQYVSQNWNKIANHKYFGTADVKATDGRITFNGVLPTITATGAWQTNQTITNASDSSSEYLVVRNSDATYPSTWQMRRVMRIDLTQKYGSSIADYIYSLETATAGAGIAKLREWGFLCGYQAFNAGSIESVEVTDKKVRGFNQWDEVWEVGYINPATGEATSANDRIRTKNFNPCLPNTAYYVKDPTSSYNVRIFYYDADKNFVSETGWNGNQILTTPSNAYFFKFIIGASYGTTYNHDICINLSSDRNGEYEPYTSQTYDYGDDVLNGIFKLDANNNLYADGDVKTADGLITRKYSLLDLGTQTWTKSVDGVFTTTGLVGQVKEPATYNTIPNLVCSKYLSASYAELRSDAKDKTVTVIWSASGSHGQVWVRDSAYTDASTFATAMSGTYLVYPLATPTTEQGDPFPSPQIVYPDGTEEYITENGVPVGHETRYEL